MKIWRSLFSICELCLKYSHSKCKQKPSTSLGQEIPMHPWTKLATDIFYFEGSSYLLLVDYTRRFLAVHKLSSMTGQHVANQCKLIFSEYGWPETLISNNGPCYTSQGFTSVMQSYNVSHITSSPHYPQSSSFAGEICPDCEKLVLQSQRGRQRFLQVYNDLPHYPSYRYYEITDTDSQRQEC